MLRELRIRNLAVVEDAVIEFSSGLNVLTGSTGAGKSIILTAVELISGGRAKKSLIRSGAGSLVIEGLFSLPVECDVRTALGMNEDDSDLSIKREVAEDGKSRIWINGVVSTNSTARETTGSLIELHGQHRQQELLDPSTHIHYLDDMGKYLNLLEECRARIGLYSEAISRLETLRIEEEENRKKEDFLRFQLKELQLLDLEKGLDKHLEQSIKRRENIHRYVSGLHGAIEDLSEEDGSVLERLNRTETLLNSIAYLDSSCEEMAESISEARITLQEVIRSIEGAMGKIDESSDDLESLQNRLAAVQRACRKYGLDCDGLIERESELRETLRSLDEGSDALIEAEREFSRIERELIPELEKLSNKRISNAAVIDRRITSELHALGMEGALFKTCIEKGGIRGKGGGLELNEDGWDRVEFRIRTNVGEKIHPLTDVASGGELSRITLVLKKMLAEETGIGTLIFDEIDSGLGADLGNVVAEKMEALSARYQIICITHLPQVVAMASQHIKVEKRISEGRTITSASVLTGDKRIAEMMRMLGGEGKLREELAVELLEKGKSARSSVG